MYHSETLGVQLNSHLTLIFPCHRGGRYCFERPVKRYVQHNLIQEPHCGLMQGQEALASETGPRSAFKVLWSNADSSWVLAAPDLWCDPSSRAHVARVSEPNCKEHALRGGERDLGLCRTNAEAVLDD